MALWKISVKNSGNVACKNKRQRLEKGMFVETSTVSTIIPLGQSREAGLEHIRLRPGFECGQLKSDVTEPTQDENGTFVFFEPDGTEFQNYQFHDEIIESMLRNYAYLNVGLTIMYIGRRIQSRHGLEDLLLDRMTNDALYPIIHLQGNDIEIAFTHANQYGEEYYSFVNGQHTTLGGTHQSAFKEHIARTIKDSIHSDITRLLWPQMQMLMVCIYGC